MNGWNTLDVTAAVLIIAATTLGYCRGFIAQLVSIAGLIAAYVAAFWLYDDISPIVARLLPFNQLQPSGNYAFLLEGVNWKLYVHNAIAFAVIFIVVKLGFSIAGRMLHLMTINLGLKTLNKWCGALLALGEVLVLIIVAVHIMVAIPSESLQRTLSSSKTASIVMDQTSALKSKLWSN
ncbi:MAG: hypothetical protein K0Q59_4293 [Paenibacillus sp.]|jgi:uncharacterized membrane protein required for colicin V production|nr:hypothetical protein [Paenibacillus sp.]